FRRIRRDVTHYGDDVLTALESGRERTPSDDFAEFLDDTSTVLRSSTDFARFTESQYRKRYRSMRQGQEEFLQRLASFAQVYIVLVFVAPALVLVLLVLLSFSGADTLPAVYVTAYVYPVVGVGLSVAALNALERQVDPPKGKPKDDKEDAEPPPDSPEYARYRRTKLRRRVLRLRPSMVRRNPLATVLLTVPVAAVALNAFFDVVGSGPAGFYSQNPVEGTSVFVAVAVFVGAPVAVLYELRRREENRFVDRIPDTYERLAEAVSVGMTPSDACRVVSETVDGKMGDVLRRIHDETSLVGDVATAFVSATERIRVPEFTVTAKTAAETLRATNDAEAALRSLAQDASARAEIRSERRGSMELYGAVVVLGLLTYVATAILLELFFLPRLTGISEAAETGFLAPPSATPDDYRTVLFHASLIQGGLNGLFIGKLRSGDIREGLVYSVVFVVAITAVFLGI
ncbi:MAG: type II secretion system F family protein, partial [Halobacteria archaeon]